jgi:hypothetical protein
VSCPLGNGSGHNWSGRVNGRRTAPLRSCQARTSYCEARGELLAGRRPQPASGAAQEGHGRCTATVPLPLRWPCLTLRRAKHQPPPPSIMANPAVTTALSLTVTVGPKAPPSQLSSAGMIRRGTAIQRTSLHDRPLILSGCPCGDCIVQNPMSERCSAVMDRQSINRCAGAWLPTVGPCLVACFSSPAHTLGKVAGRRACHALSAVRHIPNSQVERATPVIQVDCSTAHMT